MEPSGRRRPHGRTRCHNRLVGNVLRLSRQVGGKSFLIEIPAGNVELKAPGTEGSRAARFPDFSSARAADEHSKPLNLLRCQTLRKALRNP